MSYSPHAVLHTRLADIVSHDPRTASVFEKHGLDYCCQGHRTLREATLDQHVAVSEVIDELAALGQPPDDVRDWRNSRNLPDLIRHIVTNHHRFVRERIPTIQAWIEKLATKHGGRHSELLEIRTLFDAVSAEMLRHMAKEENIVFPFMVSSAYDADRRVSGSPFGTIANPIRAMEQEHREVGDLMARLRALTNGYEAPADGCTTYRVCFAELARFEADLHQHVHLENHILFPRAIALEDALA
jgi:regulator of cell morphogenesis and NO signaling